MSKFRIAGFLLLFCAVSAKADLDAWADSVSMSWDGVSQPSCAIKGRYNAYGVAVVGDKITITSFKIKLADGSWKEGVATPLDVVSVPQPSWSFECGNLCPGDYEFTVHSGATGSRRTYPFTIASDGKTTLGNGVVSQDAGNSGAIKE